MLRAEEISNFSMEGWSQPSGFVADDFDGDVLIDLDMLLEDERHDDDSEALKGFSEEMLESASPNGSIGNQVIGVRNDLARRDTLHSSYSSEVLDSIRGISCGSTLNKVEILGQRVQGSSMNASSASLEDWKPLVSGSGIYSAEKDNSSLHTCSATSLSRRDDDTVLNFSSTHQGDGEIKLSNTVAEINPQDVSYSRPANTVDFLKHGLFGQDTIGTMGLSVNNTCTSMQISVMDADMFAQDTMSKESGLCLGTDVILDYSAAEYDVGAAYPFINDEWTNHVKNEEGEFPTESACSSTKMELNDGGISGKGVPFRNNFDMGGWNNGYESNDATSIGYSFFDANSSQVDEKASIYQDFAPSYIYGRDKVKDETLDLMNVPSFPKWHSDVIDEPVSRKYSCSADYKYVHEDSRSSFSGISSSFSGHKIENLMDKKEELNVVFEMGCHPRDYINGSSTPFSGNGNFARERQITLVQPFASINNHPRSDNSLVSKVSPESSHSNFSEKSVVEDDPDICIIEDISHPAPAPAPTSQSPALGSTLITQHSTISANYMGVGAMKSKAKDDRLLLRLLQDLSQPKSELSPPEGLLAVSLLRHQKIALSWMVQKETDSSRCSGGILADDQGLGKTISTISLILKERPPSHRALPLKQDVTETLNLDEDDNVHPVSNDMKEQADTLKIVSNETPTRSQNPLVVGKGRPAAGTLIVCPTSVLRQWDEELRNKVTSKANLSVLVYHGSNRTKDPYELAKYDIVLTTYSIVSMEVPKQPRADEDDDERVKLEEDGMPNGLSSTKKRKYPPSSDKKHSNKNGLESAVPESLVRPLAKVGWFRVVLDEAQSIKNHRTQVARACWGLRAKRRWCLSGTPIQNSIDDLYSYFRFLKYDPFDVYKLFCSNIKAPINKSPANGYRKLQTVLKTIMLRRTKGTLLDGKPIINLPPKLIELKKVDFSQEEREFYSRLEADSRAQFEEYAAAGTVKQNYVNILLMLLRLRQACDHPYLVRGADSSSLWTSSVDIAKNLPREDKEHLLRCLEASLAICGICNDPPEDAVVSKCGHVFCNQCISEQLTGDEHQCPNTNCKTRLNGSSVFSKATLNSFVHDQSYKDGSDNGGPKVVESRDPSSEGLFNSSKIKAALDVLQSLCQPPNCCSGISSTQSMSDGPMDNSMATLAVEPLEDVPETQNLDVQQNSSSIKVVGQKAIVFSQWTRMLDLLEACLKNSSIKYRRLDGTMSITTRDKAVKDFNTLPEVTVMIMSLKAASLGLNMVAACHVLLLDLWWNPTTEDQAIDRAHRIGQTRPVTVLRLTVKDTVEDRILALQQKKREMVASAFGEDETGGHQSRLTVEDLRYLFMM